MYFIFTPRLTGITHACHDERNAILSCALALLEYMGKVCTSLTEMKLPLQPFTTFVHELYGCNPCEAEHMRIV